MLVLQAPEPGAYALSVGGGLELPARLLEAVIDEAAAPRSSGGAPAPPRSQRRATAVRASKRRATARVRKGDTKARIFEFLAKHPGSTAGEVAKGLNLNRGSVSTRLSQLAKEGEIKKADRGYTTNPE